MIRNKYYAGYAGTGLAVLALIDFGFNGQISERGLYRIEKIHQVFCGTPPEEGTHLTSYDFRQSAFATFEDAKRHLLSEIGDSLKQLANHTTSAAREMESVANLYEHTGAKR